MGNTIKQWTNGWKRSSVKGIAKSSIPPSLLRRFSDYFNEAQGPKYSSKPLNADNLEMSLKYNEQTLIDNPMSNRFLGGGDNSDPLEPGKGKQHISQPSTAIDSIYVDKSETKGDKFHVAIAFKSAPTNFYDYWATENDLQDLINAGSKGREVALYWNHNKDKHYP